MIRAGLILLVTSSTAVGARLCEYELFMGPEIRAACLAALGISLTLFVGTYLRVAISRKFRIRLDHLVPVFSHR